VGDRSHAESLAGRGIDAATCYALQNEESSTSFRRKGRETWGDGVWKVGEEPGAAARICAPVIGGPVKRCLAWSDRKRDDGQFESYGIVYLGVKRVCAQRSNFPMLKAVEYLPDSPV
jgi:hypothetical protein